MFTKIGEYLKPLLGYRDHVPLDAVSSIDPDDHSSATKKKSTNKKKKKTITKDTTRLSLEAVQAILKDEMVEHIELYQDVKHIIAELKKRNITHIDVRSDETTLLALMRVADNISIEKDT